MAESGDVFDQDMLLSLEESSGCQQSPSVENNTNLDQKGVEAPSDLTIQDRFSAKKSRPSSPEKDASNSPVSSPSIRQSKKRSRKTVVYSSSEGEDTSDEEAVALSVGTSDDNVHSPSQLPLHDDIEHDIAVREELVMDSVPATEDNHENSPVYNAKSPSKLTLHDDIENDIAVREELVTDSVPATEDNHEYSPVYNANSPSKLPLHDDMEHDIAVREQLYLDSVPATEDNHENSPVYNPKSSDPNLVAPSGVEQNRSDHIHTDEIQSVHNKPKKHPSIKIVQQDYVCTEADIEATDFIKQIPVKPGHETVVLIEYCPVKRSLIECLFNAEAFLNDAVIDAYIALLRQQKHMLLRDSGSAYLEYSTINTYMKSDNRTQHLKVLEDDHNGQKIDWLANKVLTYLRHDMVFFPINITNCHWYLAVVNASKRRVQVLDSFGAGCGRPELVATLSGLERELRHVTDIVGFNNDHWTDINVTTWPFEEIIKHRVQEDGYSCGLFMLNYMEYWTGQLLTDVVAQGNMTPFRLKLAAILLSHETNTLKGAPIFSTEDDDYNEDDCCIIGINRGVTPSVSGGELILTPSSSMEKQTESMEKQTESIEKQTESDLDRSRDDYMFLKSMRDMPMSRADRLDALCDWISAIEDNAFLDKVWVKSFQPYAIELSVRVLQSILKNNSDMSIDCFNLGVRMRAYNECKQLRYGPCDVPKHYMDLRFSTLCAFQRHESYRPKHTIEELAGSIDRCIWLKYELANSKIILMPWKHFSEYWLFVINRADRNVTIIDPYPIPPYFQDMPYKKYVRQLLFIWPKFKDAMTVHQPGYNDGNIWIWPTIIPDNTHKDEDGYLGAFIVLQYMSSLSNNYGRPIDTNGRTLRHEFIFDALTFKGNGYRSLLPKAVEDYLKLITGTSAD